MERETRTGVNEAVLRYYRDKYRLDQHELAPQRSLVGLLRSAGLKDVSARTFAIERIAPTAPTDERYLLEAIFQGTWGDRLRPYLSIQDFEELSRICDPQSPEFCLKRPDFHSLQTFTVVVGQR